MALSKKRIIAGGETDFPWEREAIDFVLGELPDSDPHLAWPLHELIDPGTGRLYEIDLMVLARSGLFLVEIKSNPGALTGDHQDWTFTEPGQRPKHRKCPFPTTNHKAKVLGSLLDRELGRSRPFVNPLVFVSGTEDVRVSGGVPSWLVTRKSIRQTLVHGLPNARSRVVNRPMMRQMRDAMRSLGLEPSKASRRVGGFRLQHVVDEGEGYQEHHAVNEAVTADTARVRSYLVPRATTMDRRHQLARAAQREAQVLATLGHHPKILTYRAFEEEGPLGPAVLFEAFEGGLPLHVFLKQEPDLPFHDRLELLEGIAQAADHCHRNEFVHRNLSPNSVLVRRNAEGSLELRLHRFQTAARGGHTSLGTRHVDALAQSLDRLYQAPEVLRDPDKATPASDAFSVGCLAWLLFTGQHPAASLAERERLIREHEGLHIAAVRGDLAALDRPIAFATEPADINRPDNVLEWFEDFLMEELTRPEDEGTQEIDPRTASTGDVLTGDLGVLRVLGSGSTAKVLQVQRDDRVFALKVPHDDGAARRLADEGRILGKLKHDHIIRLHEVLEIQGWTCLLMDYAGQHSLADVLRAEGTLSLEKARRYGSDLLSAVSYLEGENITHRDIKPSNIGFTTVSKKAVHLALFDFSLASGDLTSVDAGTPAWRDPWLHERGHWDAAADRYSAAAVLYKMVSGTRPGLSQDGPDQGQVRVEADRFDPAVRDRLRDFFRTCFHEHVAERHDSAELMAADWEALFGQPSTLPGHEDAPVDQAAVVQAATLTTLVEALPLSTRARNALDRAGVVTVADLLQLPRNHLSAIRGVGHKVAGEIVKLAELLADRITPKAADAFVPDYAGPRISLSAEDFDLAGERVLRLQDAGITGTADLAAAPAALIQRLLGTDGASAAHEALVELASTVPESGTLAHWAHELLAPKKKRKTVSERRMRVLLGLDDLPGEAPDDAPPGARSVSQVAAAFGIEPPLIHSTIQTFRQRWADSSGCAELEATLKEILETAGPVCGFDAAAEALIRLRGAPERDEATQRRAALALVRLGAEVRPAAGHWLQWRRLGQGAWLSTEAATLDALAALASKADELAGQEPLASSETVRAAMVELASGTPLQSLPLDRLVSLAGRASEGAATSARLEVYPRGLPAARTVKLSLQVLTPPDLSPDEVRTRCSARYPSAEPLPRRPVLDGLLAPHGLVWDANSGTYLRPGVAHATVSATKRAPTWWSTARTHQGRRRDPDARAAQAFQDALDRGVESGRFRVVQVRADFAERAAALLARELGVEPRSLDHAIWSKVKHLAAQKGIDVERVVVTDRSGPEGPEWRVLQKLLRMATEQVVGRVLAEREKPALLIHPGALARFDLAEPLYELSRRAQHEEGAAVVLLVPSYDDGLAPSINNQLPVPTEDAGQRLRMPEAWLSNAHRAAARG